MLKNADIHNIPVYSNLTSFNGNRLTVAFPPLPDDCPCGMCANCKLAICRKYRKEFPGHKLIYAGDGYSDRNVIHEVNMIFAKNEFADYCRQNKISYIPFDNFGNILSHMQMLA
jgi:2-hydroxy-3-keto-5-methylthiopentenyl-1-phosphate phosphatase